MSCYLVLEPASNGSCFAVWSEEPVEGAVAVINPGKKIPPFKFRDRGGRQELLRDVGGPKVKPRLYQGYCQFINIAKQTLGTFSLTVPGQVAVYFNDNGDMREVEEGEEINVLDYSAYAVIHKDDECYKQVKSMNVSMFLDVGIQHGYALTI